MPHLTSLARPGLRQAARPRADLSAPVPWGTAGVGAALLAAAALVVALALVADGSSGTGLGAAIFQSCYQVLLGLAVALCFARAAASTQERTAWLAMGAGLASWFAGDVAFWLWGGSESFQGFAFLLFYPGAALGVFLLVRATGWHPREFTDLAITLAAAVDSKDRYTRSHSDNVAASARRIGARVGLSEARLRRLEVAGQLHDVGKIAVPDAILLKSGPPDDEELEVMRRHASEGERIVCSIGLNDVAPWIRHHHERWDGRGYPDRLAGTAAPLEAW